MTTDESDPASGDPAHWPVGRLLSAASRRVEREWNTHLSAWDLNHASLPVLVHLLGGPRSQRQLAAACGVTEQTMSRVLARMERTGYVTRAPHADDHRRHDISVTESGREAFVMASDRRPAETIVSRGLTPAQVDELRALLVLVAFPEGRDATPGGDPASNGTATAAPGGEGAAPAG